MTDNESLSDAETTVRWIVSGRVQGVWFRDFTRRAAQALKLRGWVRNLPDGSVEAMVAGPAARVADLRRQVEEGPPLAEVDAVAETSFAAGDADLGAGDFEIRY